MKNFFINLAYKFHLNKIDDAFREFLNDLSSLKALWNHAYLLFYIVLCSYIAKVNPASHTTIITVTGGVVSVIFTSYVIGTIYEKVNGVGKSSKAPTPPPRSGCDNPDGDQ